MSWSNVDIFSVLVVLGGLGVLGVSVWRWGRYRRLVNETFVARLRNYSSGARVERIVGSFVLVVGVLVGVAIWGPEWGERRVTSEAVGADVMFVLDVSKSMQAVDVSVGGEEVDRLSMAKGMILEYVQEHPENRYGLVVFAGDAFVSSPLTFDTQAFVTFAQGVNYKDVGEQGTNLGEALGMALGRFGQDEEDRGQVLVLVSDGGDEVEGDYVAGAETAAEIGVKIVTVGVGSEEGVPIPEGKDVFGRDVYKTYQGEVVMTQLNDEPLKEIADMTEGAYVQARKVSDMNKVNQVVASVEQGSLLRSEGVEKENRYQWLVGPAVGLFAVVISWPLYLSLRRKYA